MIGDNIRKLREQKGIGQSEFAEMLGIKRQTLFKYEHNIVTNVPLNMVEKIAEEEKTGRGRRDQSRESDRLKTILVKIAPKLPRKIKENPEE